jgi:WD40 repeat protein
MAPPAVSVLEFSPDDETLAIGAGRHRMGNFDRHHPGTVTLWDLSGDAPTKRAVIGLPGAAQAFAFAPDGKTLALADDFDALKLYDARSGEVRAVLAEPGWGRGGANTVALVFSPDGGTLASVQFYWVFLWDVATGRQRARFRAFEGDFTVISPPALVFSPDGQTFAMGGLDGRLTLRDAIDGRVRATLKGHEGAVLHVAMTTDGRTLVSADQDGQVRLWETSSGRERAGLDCHEGMIWNMKISPDDQTLVTQHKDLRLWDLQTGGRRATIPAGDSPGPFSIGPDGKSLTRLDWDGALRIWDVTTGCEQGGLEFPKDQGIDRAAFSSTGETLAVAYKDGEVHLWSRRP